MEGNAHAGETVKHCSRVARDPTRSNLRQVHLIHSELRTRSSSRPSRADPSSRWDDLYHRLAVFPVLMPPLRERREDILPQARTLLDRMARELGIGERTLYDKLKRYGLR